RLGVEIDHDVVTFGLLLDLVREATTSPDVHVVDGAVLSRDNLDQVVHGVSQRPLFEVVIKNEHELVLTHMSPTSSGLCGHGRSMAGGYTHACPASVLVTTREQTSLVSSSGACAAMFDPVALPLPRRARRNRRTVDPSPVEVLTGHDHNEDESEQSQQGEEGD